jgi:predicted NUDIX family NTP pyrophosphohydrolase
MNFIKPKIFNLRKRKNIICVNCGKPGHIYKRCHLPIISYGIICLKFDNIDLNYLLTMSKKIELNIFNKKDIKNVKNILKNINEEYINNNIKFLMIKRRISYSVIEFIRGKYKLCDIDYILNTIRLMANKEKKNLIEHDFDYNWNKLWNISKENKAINYSNEYEESKNRFNKIKDGYELNIYNNKSEIRLEDLMKISGNKYDEPEWGFPKGKKDFDEEELNCAKREFKEETDFNENDYTMLKMNSINELFMGSNKVKYKNKYYIAQSFSNRIPKINKNNSNQIMEVGDIGWFTKSECMGNIREYNIEKKDVVDNLIFVLPYFIMNLKKKIEGL